ncbi:MAG: CPBP family intramembrane metalloprotease [Balneolaceae bacterium]|nr:CPBP family intramembrane metalloprotease [Balneolaceae bacterium]
MTHPTAGQGERTITTDSHIYTPWVKRNGFSHAGMALLWIVAAFLLFQIFANVLGIILILIRSAGSMENFDAANAMELVAQNIDLIFVANSSGQILFLGLATWLFCRLHTNRQNRPSFLRFRLYENTAKILGLVFVLMLVVQPVIWFLGWLNSFVPVPETMEAMQMQQMEMIQSYLTSDGMVLIALFNIALVPAICEEILFRGYVLRSFEKSWGIMWAIVISGIIFGMFHLQLANVLPLASIGILLAFMTWISQSLYPAMLAHFVNNGASVLVGKYYPETAFSELSPETMPPLWLVAVSVVVSGYLIYLLLENRITEPVN